MESFVWLVILSALLILAWCILTARQALKRGRSLRAPVERWTCDKGHQAPPTLTGRLLTCAVCGSSRLTPPGGLSADSGW